MKRIGKTSHYSFELRRNGNQADIKKALAHPTADEYDDWIDYTQIQEERKAAEKAKVEHITFLQAINEMDGSFDDYYNRHNERLLRARDEEEEDAEDDEDEGLGLSTETLQRQAFKQFARRAVFKDGDGLTLPAQDRPMRLNRASI